ncbi:short chain dehydrogenase [Advenella kashmirensis WT001]|uniref:Short chain dehydrogenase n=1 Tax=Advenella kashmirensis (strain DSM 17095 / LMG 22695 / WT001) TaxID=1036672 RepID=I3UH46_ADVKW|nr:short chain dehydrogenase [Advenella kashmirensis WT001]
MPTILITGAASGIGRASALLFASRGWRCVLVDCNATALAQLMQTLSATKSGGNVTHLVRTVDLTQATQIHSLADPSLILDAIINNAGMSDTSGLQLVDQDPVHMDRLVALNLRAPAWWSRHCSHNLRRVPESSMWLQAPHCAPFPGAARTAPPKPACLHKPRRWLQPGLILPSACYALALCAPNWWPN